MTQNVAIKSVFVENFSRNCKRGCMHDISVNFADNTQTRLDFSGKYIAKNYYDFLSDEQKGHFERYRGANRQEPIKHGDLSSLIETDEAKNFFQALKGMEDAVNRLERYKNSILLPEYGILNNRYPYRKCWQTQFKIEAIDFLIEQLRLEQDAFFTIHHPQQDDFDIYCKAVHKVFNDYREHIEANRSDCPSGQFILNFCLMLTGIGAALIAVSFLVSLPIEFYQSRQQERAFDVRYCFFGGQSTTRNILREIEAAFVIVKHCWEMPIAEEEEELDRLLTPEFL